MKSNSKALRALVESQKDVLAHLVAAHSLLLRSPKTAAPSNRMFDRMVADYAKSIERGRVALTAAESHLASSTDVEGWRVKPLEWVKIHGSTYHADSALGRWARWEGHYLSPEGYAGIACADPVASAQADYESRIRSAILPPPPSPGEEQTPQSMEQGR